MLDEKHDASICDAGDPSLYTLGCVSGHKVVIACQPEAHTGTNSLAAVAVRMKLTFTSIRFGLMVGIGGGVPSAEADIRLGDVVINRPEKHNSGVVQYDFGKSTPSGFMRTGFLNGPPEILQNAVANLRANYFRCESRLSG
jgi:nucleoside phosphorylase